MWVEQCVGPRPVRWVKVLTLPGEGQGDPGTAATIGAMVVVVDPRLTGGVHPRPDLVTHAPRLDYQRLRAAQRVRNADDGFHCVALSTSGRRAIGCLV